MTEVEPQHSFANERGTSPLPEEVIREPTLLVQAVLCCLAALEGADNQLLGASLAYTGTDLGFKLNSLSTMAITQGIFANAAAPFWGVLADRGIFRQKDLLIVAALGQGLITVLLALQSQYGPLMVFMRGLNGLFLAGLRPIANGIIAKQASESVQGKLFSRVLVFILLGGSLCSVIVTPWSGIPYVAFGRSFNGWRPAWVTVGGMSILVAMFTVCGLPTETLKKRNTNESIGQAVLGEVSLIGKFFCIPTFLCMVGQGTFGTIPWTVLWIGTRYYQAGNLTDLEAGLVSSYQAIISMSGTWLGGFLADKAAARFGYHGRPLVAQITVALAIPIMYLNFVGVPPEKGSFWIYIFIITLFGVFAQWAQGGVNWPILSTIVPVDVRSRVLAVEGAMENSLATIFGPLFLQYLANNVFNFDINQIQGRRDYPAARALGLALCITVCLPWCAAYIVYSGLHITFPADMKKMLAQEPARAQDERRNSAGSYLSSRGMSRSEMHI